MKAAFDYKETLKWRAFNLESKGKREENVDMFLSIERALQEVRKVQLVVNGLKDIEREG